MSNWLRIVPQFYSKVFFFSLFQDVVLFLLLVHLVYDLAWAQRPVYPVTNDS